MRILFLTELLAPYRADWMNELGKYASIKIVYLHDSNKERNQEWISNRPENCEYKKLKSIKIPLLGSFSNEFIKEYKQGNYDIVIIDGYSGLTKIKAFSFLNRRKIPYFVNVDGIVPKTNLGKGMIEKIKKKILSKIPYFLCGSKETCKILQKYGVKEEKIYHHNFTTFYERDIQKEIISPHDKLALRKELGLTEEKVIISVGRFSYLNGYGKGYDALLRAAKRLSKDIGWYIIGGQPTEEFEKLTKESGLTNFHYVDFKPKEELQKYYRASDIFVLMTIADVWGLVVNEAMACGLPVITTDKCMAGLDLVHEDENGYIVPVGDDQLLAKNIQKIFAENKQAKMGEASLRIIRDYTIENMAEMHIEVFEKVLNNEQ